MKSAQKTKLKKLIVAVASERGADDRRAPRCSGRPTVTPLRARPPVGGSSGSDARRGERRDEERERVDEERARRAESACTRMPPTLGPATNENARLPFSSELASTKPLALDERHEERRVRDVEAARVSVADEERDDVQLRRASARRTRRRAGSCASSAARPRSVDDHHLPPARRAGRPRRRRGARRGGSAASATPSR